MTSQTNPKYSMPTFKTDLLIEFHSSYARVDTLDNLLRNNDRFYMLYVLETKTKIIKVVKRINLRHQILIAIILQIIVPLG